MSFLFVLTLRENRYCQQRNPKQELQQRIAPYLPQEGDSPRTLTDKAERRAKRIRENDAITTSSERGEATAHVFHCAMKVPGPQGQQLPIDMAQLAQHMNDQFRQMRAEMALQFQRLDVQYQQMDGQYQQMDARLDARLQQMDARLQNVRRRQANVVNDANRQALLPILVEEIGVNAVGQEANHPPVAFGVQLTHNQLQQIAAAYNNPPDLAPIHRQQSSLTMCRKLVEVFLMR
eukprot:PhM_4_TR13310/c0_g2_i7/m.21026